MDERIVQILTGRRNTWLSTVMPDGSPHLTPIWIDVEGEELVFSTNEGTVKVANMRRDPRVALAIESEEDRYTTISVRGRVVFIGPDDDFARVDALSWRHDDKGWDPSVEETARLLVRIVPERITLLED
jgi:PPOX class probable F420-dependent enzyme